eukprot:SAG11_NODE_748_length_7364_cov_106.871025_2_plen_62_part_00
MHRATNTNYLTSFRAAFNATFVGVGDDGCCDAVALVLVAVLSGGAGACVAAAVCLFCRFRA